MTLRRAAALFEVLGVYLAGQLVSDALVALLRVRLTNPLASFTVDISNAALLTASGDFAILMLFQYAGWFLLILPINWWHRRRGPAAYGLTRAGHSWTSLARIGLVTAALAAWPIFAVQTVDTVYQLGDTAPWREAFFATSWRRWEFWLFAGVMSWALIPIIEELFFRGYVLRRLAEDWGDGAAIIGSACLFTFAHSQYLRPNAYSLAMIAGLLTLAIAFGLVFAWTRSIVPSLVAHTLVNVPMTPFWQSVMLALFLIVSIWYARRAAAVAARVFGGARPIACATLGLIGGAYAFAAQRIDGIVYVSAGLLLLAVLLESRDRRPASPAEAGVPTV